MPKVVNVKAAVRRIAADVDLAVRIRIGHAQSGQWWIKADSKQLASGTDAEVTFPLGKAGALHGKVLQVEVRCDDTNPHTDDLQTFIELAPVEPELTWISTNAGQQEPHSSMTSFIDIFIREHA
jgi:hypothetical protein